MKILRNILEHGFPALWILKKSGNVLGFRVRKKSKLKTMSCPFHWKATQGSGKSTPFAGWYRKCRERPSIMKWMWYKSGGFPALRNLSTTKTRYAAIRCRTGNPSPVIWCRRYSYLEKYIPVSYTHLDVYKRQSPYHRRGL